MNAVATTPPRSTFVTVVAWIFIVVAGFATLIALMQNVMLFFMFRGGAFDPAFGHGGAPPGMPAFFGIAFRHFYLVFAAFLGVAAATLASAIGLLLRRNWARLVFIAVMLLGIVWNLGGLALTALFMTFFNAIPSQVTSHAPFAIGGMVVAMVAINVLIALGVSAIFLWIILRLRSPEIRREFAGAS